MSAGEDGAGEADREDGWTEADREGGRTEADVDAGSEGLYPAEEEAVGRTVEVAVVVDTSPAVAAGTLEIARVVHPLKSTSHLHAT